MPSPTNIDKIPIITNEQIEPRKSPLDVQNTTYGDVIKLAGIDRQTHDSFKDINGWQGVIVREIRDPKNFEYSQRTELETLNQEGAYEPIKYKVCLLSGPGKIIDLPSTYGEEADPEDERLIDTLDDYSASPDFQGALHVGANVWITQENYKDKKIQYSFSNTLNGTVAPQQGVNGNAPPSPSNQFRGKKDRLGLPRVPPSQGIALPETKDDARSEDYPDNVNKTWTTPVTGSLSYTSLFGNRTINQKPNFHKGIDIGAPIGVLLFAIADGKIDKVTDNWQGPGLSVRLGFKDSEVMHSVLYGHMNQINVKEGQKVKKGDILGTIGTTGPSTGPHLHFQLEIENKGAINPFSIKKIKDTFPPAAIGPAAFKPSLS